MSYHISTYDTILDVNTTYSTQDSQPINLAQETGAPYFYGKISLGYVEFSVSGLDAVGSLSLRLCTDADGHHALGEWSSPVIWGLSSSGAAGTCTWKTELPWGQYGTDVYAFVKTDSGSVLVSKVTFVTEV